MADQEDGQGGDKAKQLEEKLDSEAKEKLEKMMAQVQELRGDEDEGDEEDDPFVCDVTGALIDMAKDGRYHFDDGRTPDDPSAVCMSVSAYNTFDTLAKEHPETWEEEYTDKGKWVFIPPGGAASSND